LGTSIASLVSILNIQNIIITGKMTNFGELWLKVVQEAMSEAAFNKIAQVKLGKPDLRS
jgi:predicted NBD/HSP70 family sugar kinase